jgi:hypothetical protein
VLVSVLPVVAGVDDPDEPHAADVARKANDEPSTTNFVMFLAILNPSVLIPPSKMRAPALILSGLTRSASAARVAPKIRWDLQVTP